MGSTPYNHMHQLVCCQQARFLTGQYQYLVASQVDPDQQEARVLP